jgi:hypothetical protein
MIGFGGLSPAQLDTAVALIAVCLKDIGRRAV